MELPLHSTGDASRLAALLLPHIFPICSLVAPCHPGAAPRASSQSSRFQGTGRYWGNCSRNRTSFS